MCNESKVLLPGPPPPCSRTLACGLDWEHTCEGCTAHTIMPYNHNWCRLKALGARLRHMTNCNSAVQSSALRKCNNLLGKNKDIYYFPNLTPQPGNPDMSLESMASICLIVKTAAEAPDVDFIKTKNCWMNFGLGLGQISNNFQRGPKLTSAILYDIFMQSRILSIDDVTMKSINSEEHWSCSTAGAVRARPGFQGHPQFLMVPSYHYSLELRAQSPTLLSI